MTDDMTVEKINDVMDALHAWLKSQDLETGEALCILSGCIGELIFDGSDRVPVKAGLRIVMKVVKTSISACEEANE